MPQRREVTVPKLLMSASGVALVAATAALCAHGWRSADDRFFAGLISIAVTLSLFSVVAWAATAIAPCLLPGFLSARSLFSSRYNCIESYRSRRLGAGQNCYPKKLLRENSSRADLGKR